MFTSKTEISAFCGNKIKEMNNSVNVSTYCENNIQKKYTKYLSFAKFF